MLQVEMNMSDDEPLGDTGLVAAAVTLATPAPEPEPKADPVVLPAAVQAAVTPAVPMPEQWDLSRVASLVTDVAQNMYDRSYLLKKHKLTEQQLAFLEGNDFYKRALEAETITWQGSNSIQKRLALEAAVAIEAKMPTLTARLGKETEPLADVVACLKVLAEIAGLIGTKSQANQGRSGDQFKIIINIGDERLEKAATPNFVAAVQPQPEGEGTRQALSALIQAPRK